LLIDPDQSPIPEPEARPQGEPTLLTVPSPAPEPLPEPELPNPRTSLQSKPVEAEVAPNSEPEDLEIREFDPELRRSSRVRVPTVLFNKRHYA
jgi:hypothetical protein